MKGLGSLLSRFKDSLDRDVVSREKIAECIREVAGFDVRLEDISIKNDTIRIHTTPVKKNEIKIHESEILEAASVRTKLKFTRIIY